MDKPQSGREDYVRKVLEAYRNTPGTCGNLRRSDRLLAIQLYQRGVLQGKIENALVLAAVRRLSGPPMLRRSPPCAPRHTSCRLSKKCSIWKSEKSTSNTHGKSFSGCAVRDSRR